MTSTVLLTIPNMLSFGIIAQHTRTSVGTAVDDGWHSSVVHLAQAISGRDLRDEVQQRCHEGTPMKALVDVQ